MITVTLGGGKHSRFEGDAHLWIEADEGALDTLLAGEVDEVAEQGVLVRREGGACGARTAGVWCGAGVRRAVTAGHTATAVLFLGGLPPRPRWL